MISESKRILLVDDDISSWRLFAFALKRADNTATFTHVNDGAAALEILNNLKTKLPDLIFLDLNMPKMSGRECLTRIKATKRLCHIPVIMLTGSKSERDVSETKMLGASFFITKPFDFADFVEVIRYTLMENVNAGKHLESIEVF